MELQTISKVSKHFNISTRTMRYYEQIGLIKSQKIDGYSYRTYDNHSIIKLEQILFLRKLRIGLKEIKHILQKEEAVYAIQVFQEKINEINDEINALSTIRNVLSELVFRLNPIEGNVKLKLLADETILRLMNSLTITKINFKEETSMEDFNQANHQLKKLKDVRIIYLPPATVLSIQRIGNLPELSTLEDLKDFIKQTDLIQIKPDLRHYGFNHPNGEKMDGSDHGYERWLTIPEDMEVKPPFIKKQFTGGLYAAHMIPMGNFEEWEWLISWVNQNDDYEINWGDQECMDGLMEEHLNYVNLYNSTREEIEKWQLDLLCPIKVKKK